MSNPPRRDVEIFDTTLRDGLQVEGVSATVEDKLRIAEQLDYLGVTYIEGGWPGANPKDIEFFGRAAGELRLDTATPRRLRFDPPTEGTRSTRTSRCATSSRPERRRCASSPRAGTTTCIEALQTTLDEGEAMIADSVEYLVGHGRRVLVDMEHFFDGYKRNPEFAMRAVEAAVMKGAGHVVLCDTNGGSLPHEVGDVVAAVRAHIGSRRRHRHPLPRRHWLRRGQLDGGRVRRCPPRAGHSQRPRRAHRQRQPDHDHPQPPAQAGLRPASPKAGSND